MKKATALILLAALLFAAFTACGRRVDPAPARPTAVPSFSPQAPTETPPIPDDAPQYTFIAAMENMATTWDPHALNTREDGVVASFLTCPLVHRVETDTESNGYEWVFEMAAGISDVTFTNRADLAKYGCELGGADPDTVNTGYVFSISIEPRAVWQDGTKITADSFIYSMRRLLDPDNGFQRAGDLVYGPGAVAGGRNYHLSGRTVFRENASDDPIAMDALIGDKEGNYHSPSGERAYFSVDRPLSALDGSTPKELVTAFGEAFFDMEKWKELTKIADENGLVPCTDSTRGLMAELFACGDESGLADYLILESAEPKADFDSVGIYKVDEYTFNYVCERPVQIEEFYALMENNWLVYEPFCENTAYGTAPENTMSCGPYLMVYAGPGRIELERNPLWYGWETAPDGDLISYTKYHVNGEHLRRFETTRIVFKRLSKEAAAEAYADGGLTLFVPGAEERPEYEKSRGLYLKSTGTTVCILTDPELDSLTELDSSGMGSNTKVLSNLNFRRSLEICIDRAQAAKLTAWDTPCLGLINENCLIYGAPYRGFEPAMQALLDHFGLEFGEGSAYPTLSAAYEALTGCYPSAAAALMRTACEELTEEGLYVEGEDIVIRIAWSEGGLTEADYALCGSIEDQLNAAASDSGFGQITLTPVGFIGSPADAVSRGEYAMGIVEFDGKDPVRALNVFTDPGNAGFISAAAVSSEPLTITVDGADETMTRLEWARSLVFPGKYSDPSLEARLLILAELEKQCMESRCCIPLFAKTEALLLSERAQFISGDPGDGTCWSMFETLAYNYNDADWEEHLSPSEE